MTVAATPLLMPAAVTIVTPAHAADISATGGPLASGGPASMDSTSDLPDPWLDSNTSRTQVDQDGSITLESYSVPVNYADGAHWAPIDNTLVESTDPQYAAQNASNSYTVKLPADAGSTPVKFSSGGAWVTLTMRGLDSDPQITENDATYTDVAHASSVSYETTSQAMKESIVLASPPSTPVSYKYTISASEGLAAAKADDGSIVFSKPDGLSAIIIPLGNMSDASEAEAASGDVAYTLATDGPHQWILTVTPSFDWLTAASRAYPVTIDPSLTNQRVSNNEGCWIQSADTTMSSCFGNYLRVGRSDSTHRYRTLLDFSVASIPDDATITSASVSLTLDSSQTLTTNSATYSLFKAGAKFSSSATWSSSGQSGSWDGGSPTGSALASLSMQGNNGGVKTFAGLQNIVQAWVTNPGAKTGFVLKQDPESANNVLYFYADSSSNDANRPHLTVNYTVPQPNDTSCDAVNNTGIDPSDPDPSLPAAQYQAQLELIENTCFSYPTAERCETDSSTYVGDGCVSKQAAWGNRDIGTGDYQQDNDPRGQYPIGADGGNPYGSITTTVVAGPTIGTPSSGAFAWSSSGELASEVVAQDAHYDETLLKSYANAYKVPYPDPASGTATRHASTKYVVYQIYALKSPPEHPYFRLYKYGITRQEPWRRRTQGQIKSCIAEFAGADCDASPIQQNVTGFFRARQLEAAHILHYTIRYGEFPPGNPIGM